jgi:hypothetical protein
MKPQVIFRNQYFIISVVLVFINLMINGCYSFSEITPNSGPSLKIYKIETLNGKIVEFKNSVLGYATIEDSSVVSIKANGEKEKFPLSNVKKYYTEKLDVFDTVALSLGCVVIILGIIFIATYKMDYSGLKLNVK